MRKLNITKGKFADGYTGWKVENRITNYTQIGFEIHFSEDGECVTDHVYTKDDAILISKAPEMLELLKSIIECYNDKGQLLSFNINSVRQFLNTL